ncbi:MAG TPA: bifunctional riboflavin kinase/FAD synthetase [Caulobacteraceae bacterium]|jgi:riboflavin kinase/FMN adenylyltransferase|nr:bifunctional riboflavin kinase/FAD synthetase [Caulobacteraceae bacterium]
MAFKVVHGWKNLSPADKGAAVALGNFDGVHLGHQKVIAEATEAAARLAAPVGVISFEPHARMHFEPDAPPFRLSHPHQLARIVEGLGAQRLYLLPFGAEMANFSDHDFVADVLVRGLGVRHVAVGFDISFGKGRTGDPDSMRRYGEEFGFSVSVAEAVTVEGVKISSTAVREALREGRPGVARAILGRPFAIEGVVQKGRQLGRKLGFPTANVLLGDYVAPKFGVYATRTRLADGRRLGGVANIGVNPTTGEVDPRLEVWLFDFDEDIYGETIETELIAFLRPEEKFSSIPVMVEQIWRDAAQARQRVAPDS